MVGLPGTRLEVGEICGFVGKKERNVKSGEGHDIGSVWTWCAIDADTKLVPALKVGQRKREIATAFLQDVSSRMATPIQLTSDAVGMSVSEWVRKTLLESVPQ